mmetsp:Transcript_45240/g.33010  ORF Transcript_45240/g.33010 Transcript_45240/m.33010 type:complete len:167 (+) Transcript_45240:279-779(+)
MKVAKGDHNSILFEKLKNVISGMAKAGSQKNAGQQEEGKESDSTKQNKILMTEIMTLMLKTSKDQQMQRAYSDCFLFLTKHYFQQGNKKMLKFLTFTYKELLKKFLGGRNSSSAINSQFFKAAFEQNSCFGWVFFKVLLKCSLPKGANDLDEEEKEEEGKGARSNH